MIKAGIIGAGNNGRGHARKLSALKGRCEVVAIADPQIELAREAAGECGAKALEDYRAFFDEVEAVFISSPNWLHVAHLADVVAAGKHVFCEKPLAMNRADAEKAKTILEAATVKSMVGVSVRFGWICRTMKRYLDEGRLGEPISAFSRRLHHLDPERLRNGWRGDVEKSGGVFHELITHEMDWIMWMLGVPESIACRIWSHDRQHPRANENVNVLMGFPGGASASLEGSQVATLPEFRIGLQGAEAGLVTDHWNQRLYLHRGGDPGGEEIPAGEPFDKHGHFIDVLEGKTDCEADGLWGVTLSLAVEDALDSAVASRAG